MYATAEDLAARLGTVYPMIYGDDSAAAASDIDSAAAEINGAIAGRYRVPVTAAAALPLLKDWTLTLAEERTYSRSAGPDYSDKVKRRVDQVRKYLEMIRTDQFRLAAEENQSIAGGGVAMVQSETLVFDRDSLAGF